MWHATDVELIEYLDGELFWFAHWRVHRHLRSCWQCRAQVDEIRAVEADFVRYRQRLLIPALPTPPGPWRDLPFDTISQDEPAREAFGWRPLVVASAFALCVVAAGYLALTPPPQAMPLPAAPPSPRASRPAPLISPAPDRPPLVRLPAQSEAASRDEEVRIIFALHRIGADLGEAVDLHESAGKWVITASGLSEDRVQELRRAAGSVPVQIAESRSEPASSASPAGGRFAASTHHEILTPRLGGPVSFERTANRILEESDLLLARAYALRNLDRRFANATGLETESLALLEKMRAAHRGAYREHAGRLEQLTAPLRAAIDAPALNPAAAGAADPVTAGQRLDQVLNELLAGAKSNRTLAEVGAELSSALAALRGSAH